MSNIKKNYNHDTLFISLIIIICTSIFKKLFVEIDWSSFHIHLNYFFFKR